MRSLCVGFLAVAVVTLSGYHLFAQLPPGGRYGGDGAGLLLNKGVQEELKLTEEQKTKIREAIDSTREKYGDDFKKAREAKDREKGRELMRHLSEDMHKAVAEFLSPEQRKRLKQIHYQTAGPTLFTHHNVEKDLSLTEKQKQEIKDLVTTYDQEVRELREGSQGEPGKQRDTFRKIGQLRRGAAEKARGLLTDAQKRAWKQLVGEPFDVQDFTRRSEARPGADK